MKLVINDNQLEKLVSLIKEDTSNPKKNVLFIGDSLSNGVGYTWNYELAEKYPNWSVKHITKAGESTSWMLNQLVAELSSKKYDLVFIYGGTNDMFSLVSIDQTLDNFKKMIDIVKRQGGKTIIFTGYDAGKVMSKDNLIPTNLCDINCMLKGRERMIELQKKLQRLEDATIIPTYKKNADPSWSKDGIHVGRSIHSLMADYIYDYLENTESLKSKKTTQKSMGKTFLDKMKNVVNNYLSKSFGSLFGQTTLKDKFVSSLEKTNENFLVNSNDLLIEANTLEYKKGDMNYSDATAKFQLALQLLGFSLENWGVDGIFGPETKKAVKDFQKENNLKVTGVIDSITRRKIIDIVKTDVTDEDFMNAQFTKTESLPATDIKLTGDRFENFAIDKHSEDFLLKVQNIAKKVDLDYKIILAIMFFESEMNPSAQNPSSNATGLIQFMPTTAKSLGTSVSELKNMSAIDQLDYVEKFFMDKKRSGLTSKVKSPEEAYLLVFYPLAVTKSNDFILGSEISDERAKKIYSQNKPFDTNKDGFISKGEVLQYIRKKWGI